MKVEQSIVIRRPPDEVFDFLVNRSNDVVWMASVVESEWLSESAADTPGAVTVGRRGRMVMRFPGGPAEFVDEVAEYEHGRRIAHRTVSGPIPLYTACVCEPTDQGCRATVSGAADRLPGGFLGRIASPFMVGAIRRGFRADLVTLKKLLEAGPPAGR
jgi:hypothetical protein